MFKLVSFSYPHMIVVMKIDHLEEITESCIMKRWSKLAKEGVQVYHDNESQKIWLTLYNMVYSAPCVYECLILHFNRKKLLKMLDVKFKDSLVKWKNLVKIHSKGLWEILKATKHHVQDLDIMKTKSNLGTLRDKFQKPRCCGKCKKIGHIILKCSVFVNSHNAPIHIEDFNEEMVWSNSSLNSLL